MNLHEQNSVCCPPVGPQDVEQTYIHTCTESSPPSRVHLKTTVTYTDLLPKPPFLSCSAMLLVSAVPSRFEVRSFALVVEGLCDITTEPQDYLAISSARLTTRLSCRLALSAVALPGRKLRRQDLGLWLARKDVHTPHRAHGSNSAVSLRGLCAMQRRAPLQVHFQWTDSEMYTGLLSPIGLETEVVTFLCLISVARGGRRGYVRRR